MGKRRLRESDLANACEKIWDSALGSETFFALETLLLSRLPSQARILDLWCGIGQVSRFLADCGFRVTGIDPSDAMIDKAIGRVPGADFLCGDVRTMVLPRQFHAVVCRSRADTTWTLDELTDVFRSVHGVLLHGGFFCFEILTDEAFTEGEGQPVTFVQDDYVSLIRRTYDAKSKLGVTDITCFHMATSWNRSDVRLTQRCFSATEVEFALTSAGFREIHCYHAEDIGMSESFSPGRIFLLSCKRNGVSERRAAVLADAA